VVSTETFPFLSKILPELVFPLTLALLCLLIVLLGGRLARWRRGLLVEAIGSLGQWLGVGVLSRARFRSAFLSWEDRDPEVQSLKRRGSRNASGRTGFGSHL